jgi:hypothetical protein
MKKFIINAIKLAVAYAIFHGTLYVGWLLVAAYS